MKNLSRLLVLFLVGASACRSATEPRLTANLTCRTADGDLCLPPDTTTPPPPPAPVMDTLRFLACPVATAWQFDVDRIGNTYRKPGEAWALPAGGTMKIPATAGTHWVDMTRWMPTIAERADSVTTGIVYQLPCP